MRLYKELVQELLNDLSRFGMDWEKLARNYTESCNWKLWEIFGFSQKFKRAKVTVQAPQPPEGRRYKKIWGGVTANEAEALWTPKQRLYLDVTGGVKGFENGYKVELQGVENNVEGFDQGV